MNRNVVERIVAFNQGRNPESLQTKYQAMQQDPFVFFRGTCHIFYEDWPKDSLLNQAPPVWNCGDLHLQNFGSYKGDNRLVYFDINDFDEGVLAPCTWDVTRFVTSILVGASTIGVKESEAMAICYEYLDSYSNTLAKGQARTVEKETAQGMVKEHLETLNLRKRKEFLDKRTQVKNGKRRFIIDGEHYHECPKEKQDKIKDLIDKWSSKREDKNFFQVLDIAERIAGTGSLGVARYGIIVEGKGSPNDNYILDLKQAGRSSLEPYVNLPQPKWDNEAQRIVNIQQKMQGTPPALLSDIHFEGCHFILRELQPSQDKIDLVEWNGKLSRLAKVLKTMGQITAWDQLRSTGRKGSAITDDLIAFATENQFNWRNAVLDYARNYSQQVKEDFTALCESNLGK